MKRLLFVLYELAYGGVERQAELLAEAARSAGHEVTLLVLGPDGPAHSRFLQHCRQIIILNAPLGHDYQLSQRIHGAVADQKYDLAFLFSTAKMTLISNALSQAVEKHVVPVGNPVSASWLEYAKLLYRTWIFPPSQSLCLVANSQHTLRSLQGHPYYRRFPLHVSLNSVRIPAQPVILRRDWDILHLGMVARLDRIKDQATLIKAVGLLAKQGLKVRCELLGRGELEEELTSLARAEGVLENEAIVFAGWVADVEERLRKWDLFVFSTTAQEGFGNAAAEAMAYGLPCIFTDIGPCREVGADAVEYVPPQDVTALATAIRSLANDPDRRQRLGGAAYARACQHFRPGRNLEDYLKIAFAGDAQ
jgi:glycosyltransferase involved in cell wall biosynthesis